MFTIVSLLATAYVTVEVLKFINKIVKPQFKSFKNHTTQEIGDAIDLYNRFSMQLTNALFTVLKKNEPSLVINIGSMAANLKMPYLAIYSATKSALMSLSANLRAEMRLESREIEILCILVGNKINSRAAQHSNELHGSNS